MTGATTREQIVQAADRLLYERGFEHTSFADIAGTVGLSRGNFYYDFKSKDANLDAVIQARLGERRGWLVQWEDEEPDPAARLLRFIEVVHANRAEIQEHGCPVGTLTTELAKLEHPMLDRAGCVMTLFRDWLREQFALMFVVLLRFAENKAAAPNHMSGHNARIKQGLDASAARFSRTGSRPRTWNCA
jgi:AcrR family transcriptional regulator